MTSMRQRSATRRNRMMTSPVCSGQNFTALDNRVDHYLGQPVMVSDNRHRLVSQYFAQRHYCCPRNNWPVELIAS